MALNYRTTEPSPKILLIGDSLTQGGSHSTNGWAIELQRRYLRRADVLNRGLSGWTSRWALRYIDSMLSTELGTESEQTHNQGKGRTKCLFATLWYGANDANLPGSGRPRYHVPIPEYIDNMRTMSRKVLKYTDILFLMSPPPVCERNREKFSREMHNSYSRDLTEENTKLYVDALLAVAEELRAETEGEKVVVPVDVCSLFLPRKSEVLFDGLHFNEIGDELLIEKVFVPRLAELGLGVNINMQRQSYGNSAAPSAISPVLPWHDDEQSLNF